MKNNITIEVCCGSVDDVKTAISNPYVDRIELNSALELGGLTPSISVLRAVKKLTDLPICCMSRCRGDGFCYNETEYQIIKQDARLLLANGADGVVFGFLNPDKTIDVVRTKEMVELIKSYGKQAVFHKAFDLTKDMVASLETLIECGVDRVLTSGGPDIMKGIPLLKDLQAKYGDKIQILPGGGIRNFNVHTVLSQTNLKQVHASATEPKVDFSKETGGYKAVNKEKLDGIIEAI